MKKNKSIQALILSFLSYICDLQYNLKSLVVHVVTCVWINSNGVLYNLPDISSRYVLQINSKHFCIVNKSINSNNFLYIYILKRHLRNNLQNCLYIFNLIRDDTCNLYQITCYQPTDKYFYFCCYIGYFGVLQLYYVPPQ